MRYRNKEIETSVVGDEIMEENGKLRNGNCKDESEKILTPELDEPQQQQQLPIGTEILNPFVHRLELETTYDKLKVRLKLSRVLSSFRAVSPRAGAPLRDAAIPPPSPCRFWVRSMNARARLPRGIYCARLSRAAEVMGKMCALCCIS